MFDYLITAPFNFNHEILLSIGVRCLGVWSGIFLRTADLQLPALLSRSQ